MKYQGLLVLRMFVSLAARRRRRYYLKEWRKRIVYIEVLRSVRSRSNFVIVTCKRTYTNNPIT